MQILHETDRHELIVSIEWCADKAKDVIKQLYTKCINTFEQEKILAASSGY